MHSSLTHLLLLFLLVVPLNAALAQSSPPARVIPACGASGAHDQWFTWSHVLRFTLPDKDVQFLRGKVDVDYTRDLVQRKSTSAVMSLWSGPLSFSPNPPPDLVQKSPANSIKELHSVDGSLVGFDSFGVTTEGKHWRNTFFGIEVHGFRYENASAEDAIFFDRIIDSACIAPASKTRVGASGR
jgi:hypothetical protein